MSSVTKVTGTGANVDLSGNDAWTSTSNITANNNSYAQALISDGANSDYLTATNFGFSIPSGDTIDGITVVIEHNCNYPDIEDNIVKLYNGTSLVGDNKASATMWNNNDEVFTYGGATDTWAASLTVTQINSSGFGVYLSATNTFDWDTTEALCDYIQITIYHTEAVGGGSSSQSRVMFIGL